MVESRGANTRSVLQYLATFIGVYYILTIILSELPIASRYFMACVTEGACLILSYLGFMVAVVGNSINTGYAELAFQSSIYLVNQDCTGLSLVLLVAAATVAVPAHLSLRILGLTLISLFAAMVGCMRIVILGCVAEYNPEIFHLFHTYIMEVATVGFGLWILTIWFELVEAQQYRFIK